MNETDQLAFVREYLTAVESGATGDELARFYTPDVVQEEFPNLFTPHGARRGLPEILDAALKGQQVCRSQRYEVRNALSNGDHVALEVMWSATLAIPLGTLAAGSQLSAHLAMFIRLRDGRIAEQRNYDCVVPWP